MWKEKSAGEGSDGVVAIALILHSLSQERRSQRLKWKFILYFRGLERADRVLREDFSPSICL